MDTTLTRLSKDRLARMRGTLGNVEVLWSEHTGTFYASARECETKTSPTSGTLAGLIGRGPGPNDAVDALWTTATDPGVLMVRDAYATREGRREIRWQPASLAWQVRKMRWSRADQGWYETDLARA